MATLFESLVLLFLPRHCYEQFFLQFDFFHVECWKMFISRALGYGVILGSTGVKLPQMIKIYNAGSVGGLSLTSFLLELMAVTCTMTYNIANHYPFSTWGESFFVSLQCAVLVVMYFYYTNNKLCAAMSLPIYVFITYLLGSGITPMAVLINLQATTIPVMTFSKSFQVWANYKNGNTGQLSAITTFLNLAGTLARIFTTLQEVNDALILFSFIISSTLNGTLAFQIVYYWNVKVPDESKDK
ncbi:mannose-P-dolichol utilization defect 1 protein-like [Corticium candelabrum]|uniref:mannose-P-dolichol utilization defect 1 protein-like n=1 Tax=Corticium candelabrum TaxID=121492 RepID=UPI002E268D0C|nr:mannose-P-dolichol utilization defect 1 protein-like [Corticium candelabrum]